MHSTTSSSLAAGGLLAIAGMHAGWAAGASWPFPDRTSLAASGAGMEQPPSPAACLAVAGLLCAAAAFVGGRPRRAPVVARAGSSGVVAVLAARGALGLAGRTSLVSPYSLDAEFKRRDRRLYSPLCLALAALAVPGCRR